MAPVVAEAPFAVEDLDVDLAVVGLIGGLVPSVVVVVATLPAAPPPPDDLDLEVPNPTAAAPDDESDLPVEPLDLDAPNPTADTPDDDPLLDLVPPVPKAARPCS